MGAVHVTLSFVGVAVAAVTPGAAGLPGFSATSVTVMVSVCVAVPRPVACTITIYSLLPAAFAGVVLWTSCGFS